MSATHLPVACSLDARELGQRQSELRAGILGEATTREPLPDGYRWTFAHGPDRLARLGAVVDAERRCCRFLRFSLSADPDLGTVTLEATGPAGTRDFLETWIAAPR